MSVSGLGRFAPLSCSRSLPLSSGAVYFHPPTQQSLLYRAQISSFPRATRNETAPDVSRPHHSHAGIRRQARRRRGALGALAAERCSLPPVSHIAHRSLLSRREVLPPTRLTHRAQISSFPRATRNETSPDVSRPHRSHACIRRQARRRRGARGARGALLQEQDAGRERRYRRWHGCVPDLLHGVLAACRTAVSHGPFLPSVPRPQTLR